MFIERGLLVSTDTLKTLRVVFLVIKQSQFNKRFISRNRFSLYLQRTLLIVLINYLTFKFHLKCR